jgi:hypothetical protein
LSGVFFFCFFFNFFFFFIYVYGAWDRVPGLRILYCLGTSPWTLWYCTAWELVPGLSDIYYSYQWVVLCARLFDGYHSGCYWDHSALLIHAVSGEDHSSISARLNDNLNDDQLVTWPGFYFTIYLMKRLKCGDVPW